MTLQALLHEFRRLRVLIVGDVCLDRWCRYDPKLAEASRETGLPRTAVVRTEVTPGAAGTVANNLAALGAGEIAILGTVGNDGNGLELRRALERNGIATERLVESANVVTFTYTKLINEETGVEDLPRVDVINREDLPAAEEAEICRRLEAFGGDYDVVIVSDQAETERGGVVTARVRETLARLHEQRPEQVIWVDSRLRASRFRGAILKINDQEADAACAALGSSADYEQLRQAADAPLLLVTRGAAGVTVVNGQSSTTVPTIPVDKPVDICGAGDSFSAGAALTFAVTRSAERAARVGNMVASITIMKPGTGTASPEELLAVEAARVGA